MSSLLSIAANGAAGDFYDYQIENSLRLDNGASATLTRTPSSSSNRRTWTWSGWVKKTKDGVLFQAVNGSAFVLLRFLSNTLDIVRFQNPTTFFRLQSSAVFRDPSAWYHIVVVFDTTQATASDRIQFYVNGSEITSFATASYPSQNSDWDVNLNVIHTGIGDVGYASDVNFIDGQALDPTSFGETKSGVWIPKDTSGLTFGTNGFRLEFGDSSAIGDDTSGNGNDYTANNLSAHDVVPDSPTLNYSTLNPLTLFASNTDLAEGSLKASGANKGAGSNWGSLFSTFNLPSTGKYYVEAMAFIVTGSGNTGGLAVVDTAVYPSTGRQSTVWYNFTTGEGYDGLYLSLFNNNAQPFSDGVGGTTEGSITGATSVGMLAVDIDNGKVWAGYDGNWLASGDPAAGTNEIATRTFTETDAIIIGTAYNGSNDQGMWANFGQDSTFGGTLTAGGYSDANGYGDFAYPVPNNFLALNSANLPEPDITPLDDDLPEDYFNTVTYAGNNTAGHSITGVGFSSDFTWIKNRSASNNHILTDTVRGVTETLFSDSTSQELTTAGALTSFDSDGFTVGYDSTAIVNASGNNYVAWNWLAGGTAVSNTDGSITSSVSANTEAGFSIVGYTGDGTSATRTIGCGLTKKPEMVIIKNRTDDGVADTWFVWHTAFGTASPSKYMTLYNTDAVAASGVFVDSSFSDNSGNALFAVSGSYNGVNKSGTTYIAYCFHSVEGYSKFGSYTGNGSSDGTFVYTGFRPAWVMGKRTNTTSNWFIHDSKRSENNPSDDQLQADVSTTEYANNSSVSIDLLSNGFKLRNSSGMNGSGSTYIYMAFAEMPTKYANAK